MRFLIPFLLACLPALPCAAQDDAQNGEPNLPPPDGIIVAMAQHLVQEEYMFGGLGHYHIEFDAAYIHPQPDPTYFAVVGGFVSDQTVFNTYIAAIRLICDEPEQVECWRLEKLAINNEIVLDLGEPL